MFNFQKFKSWQSRQRGNPNLLIISALMFTVTFILGHKIFYQPWSRKKMLKESEEIANRIYEEELREQLNAS
ncbi:hypothetical protein ABEB36_001322 [Hypothenemus hampei]|uniref:Uncharacterized protein n=1 Tax=Hypothenemus hampei TaxID=57062 RepID=A0ABD1FHR7_HYPHA